jgi:hypothetical protein
VGRLAKAQRLIAYVGQLKGYFHHPAEFHFAQIDDLAVDIKRRSATDLYGGIRPCASPSRQAGQEDQ